MRTLLPERLLQYSINDGKVIPHYLGERDYPCLVEVIEAYEAHIGLEKRALFAYLSERAPLEGSQGRYKLAVHCLKKALSENSNCSIDSRKVRELLFLQAGESFGSKNTAEIGVNRDAIIQKVALSLGKDAFQIEREMFWDLPGERLVPHLERGISKMELVSMSNLLLVQGLLARSISIEVALIGNAKAIVRHAKLRGLICVVEIGGKSWGSFEGRPILNISGPFSLFKKTTMYGKALAELVPILMWSKQFNLRALCHLRHRNGVLCLSHRDFIKPANEPRRYDSKLEQRFARDVMRKMPDWDLIREPEPLQNGISLIFPDFLLRSRHQPEREWFVEIVGFWTPQYLENKLKALNAMENRNFIICVDESLNCSENSFPKNTKLVFFKNSIDVLDIAKLLSHS